MKVHLIRPHTLIVALSLLMSGAAWAQPPGPPPPPPPGPGGPPPPVPMQTDALGAIQRAHDTINQAVSFTQISKDAAGVSLGPLVTQGKTAYQEALSRYQASDLIGARELATAANDLSRAVVELATTMTQANGQVPQPPTPIGVNDDAFRANDPRFRSAVSAVAYPRPRCSGGV